MSDSASPEVPTGRDDPPGGRFVEAHNTKGLNPEHPENPGLRLSEDLARSEYELTTPGVKEVLELLFDTKKPENEARWRSLIDSTVAYTQQVTPMLGLIGGEPNSDREGRGNYFDVPVPKDPKKSEEENRNNKEQAILYTKGSGNKILLNGEREYPGFSDLEADKDIVSDIVSDEDINRVFHDYPEPGIVPRTKGAASFDSCRNEFINAAVVFAETVKRKGAEDEGWTDVAQAVDAGVTIPVGVLRLPKLSEHQWDQAQKELDKLDKSSEEYKFYSNPINKDLAIVGLIVPNNKRRSRKDENGWYEQSLDKEVVLTTARTLRGLIDNGMVHHRLSAHAQNIYTKGFMAQADNEDLVFLGDCKSDTEKETLISEALSAELMPSFRGWVIPPDEALKIQEIRKVLFTELLKGIVSEDVVDQLTDSISSNPQEVRSTIARLFVERSNNLPPGDAGSSAYWKKVASYRKKGITSL